MFSPPMVKIKMLACSEIPFVALCIRVKGFKMKKWRQ
jgi:hypothetical protein